jgi:hypothetical protein
MWENATRVIDCDRVVCADVNASLEQPRDDVQRGRLADIVGVRFERQPEDGDRRLRLLVDYGEELPDRAFPLPGIDVEDCR